MSSNKILRAMERDVIAICSSNAMPNESDLLFKAAQDQIKITRAQQLPMPELTAKELAIRDMQAE